MDFVALDVETANSDCSSICQIGIARYEDGRIVEQWSSLVNPEDSFDGFNVSLHGISDLTVKDSPTFSELFETLRCYLEGRIALCHTPFDRVSISQACSKYDFEDIACTWIDSARVARRTWPEVASTGYGLCNVCAIIGYEFRHHDALEDAKAAAHILLTAITQSGLTLEGWLKRVQQPIVKTTIAQSGNPEGLLHGEVLVFTGALQMKRSEAAALAAKIGCTVAMGVTKQTTILVVGDQEEWKLDGYDKSSKHRKAEELVKKGQALKILTERDFNKLAC